MLCHITVFKYFALIVCDIAFVYSFGEGNGGLVRIIHNEVNAQQCNENDFDTRCRINFEDFMSAHRHMAKFFVSAVADASSEKLFEGENETIGKRELMYFFGNDIQYTEAEDSRTFGVNQNVQRQKDDREDNQIYN